MKRADRVKQHEHCLYFDINFIDVKEFWECLKSNLMNVI